MRRGRARGLLSGGAEPPRPRFSAWPGRQGRLRLRCPVVPPTRGKRGEAMRDEVRWGKGAGPCRGHGRPCCSRAPIETAPAKAPREREGRAQPSPGSHQCRGAALSSPCFHQTLPLSLPRAAGSGRSPRVPGWGPCWCPSRHLRVPLDVLDSREGSAVRCDPVAPPRAWRCRGSARRGQESSPSSTRSRQSGHLLLLLPETWAPGA